jgi:hypothetical protein
MFVKEYNSNHYVFLKTDEYACKRNYYDELIRIQYNKVYTYPNTIDLLEQTLKQSVKQINKQNNQRE